MGRSRWQCSWGGAGRILLLSMHLSLWSYGLGVTLSNKEPRRDTEGKIINCHDGNIVGPVNGTYFLYGEWYGDGNFVVSGEEDLPKLSVYTSRTLAQGSWEFRGLLHNNTEPGWEKSPHWPWAPHGVWYSPSAIWSPARQRFVIYWSASQAGCCDALFGIAQSTDGIHFELMTMQGLSGLNVSTDDSSLLIDDDGVGYVAYTAMDPGSAGAACSPMPQDCPNEPGRTFCSSNQTKDQCHYPPSPCPACPGGRDKPSPRPAHPHNHMVAIDRLSPDLLRCAHTTCTSCNVSSVESAVLHVTARLERRWRSCLTTSWKVRCCSSTRDDTTSCTAAAAVLAALVPVQWCPLPPTSAARGRGNRATSTARLTHQCAPDIFAQEICRRSDTVAT
eukprot:COSAG02_NODE_423_length_22576_cov_62.034791_15_plen_389_part_00